MCTSAPGRNVGGSRLPPGYSLLELLLVCGVLMVVTAMALPLTGNAIADGRAYAAARYMLGQCQLARAEAVKRSTRVALRFEKTSGEHRFRMYADANGNGVRSQDIARGIDRPVSESMHLGDLFPGVAFGIPEPLPAIDGAGIISGDGIRLGSSGILTYSPLGSATPGTLYLHGRDGQMWAVRILGDTGRTRVLRFEPRTRVWQPY